MTYLKWISTSCVPPPPHQLKEVVVSLTTLIFFKLPDQMELPVLDTRLSKQVHNILAQRRKENGGRLTKLLIARQNFDAAEIEFADMLMEDHNNAALAYPDCTSSALPCFLLHSFPFSRYYGFFPKTDTNTHPYLCRFVSSSQTDHRCCESRRAGCIDSRLLNCCPCPDAERFHIVPWSHRTGAMVMASMQGTDRKNLGASFADIWHGTHLATPGYSEVYSNNRNWNEILKECGEFLYGNGSKYIR